MNIGAVSQSIMDLGSNAGGVSKSTGDSSFFQNVEKALSSMNPTSLNDKQDALDLDEISEDVTSLIMSFYANGGNAVSLQDAQKMTDIILGSDAMLDLLSYNQVTLNDIFLSNLNGGVLNNDLMDKISNMDFSKLIDAINQEISADVDLNESISKLIMNIMSEIDARINQNAQNAKLSEANMLYDVAGKIRLGSENQQAANASQDDGIYSGKKTDDGNEIKSKGLHNNEGFGISLSNVEVAELTLAKPLEGTALAGSVLEIIETSITSGKDNLFIKLKPDFLGGIAIKLAMSENGVVAKIVTNNQTTQSLLAGQLSNLENSLREKGIDVARMEVLYNPLNQDGQRQGGNGQEHGRGGFSRGFAIEEIDEDMHLQYLQLIGEDEELETGVYNA